MKSLVSTTIAIIMLPTSAQAWDLVPGHDPALWSQSRTMLVNPDPHVIPQLRQLHSALSVQCQKGRRLAFVNHNFEVEAKAAVVSTSLDNGSATTELWRDDTGIALEPADPVRFVRRLRGHRSMRMTVTWPGAVPTSTEFDVAGLEKALMPLHRACGW